jgi:hypothetical protein
MNTATKKIANLTFKTDRHTSLTFKDLFTWVIWQFPRTATAEGLTGAVKPPIAEHDWFPAIIDYKKKRVLVYAHLSKTFTTPEAAAESIQPAGNGLANSPR